ncbi:hypothetical protein F0562_027267 [Nyssa sinensis]|uniref:PPPDE domain-containing protein n=1 Tax=Nyssa sinensis TaxID=561372 RepID=A0A5J5B4M6_9ASTE|nr:hypothetical protein F0562_027267 [Nyssa sinensis]
MKFGSKKGWKSIVPFRLRGKSATRFCLFPKVKPSDYGPGNTPVYLNVYDLTPKNGYVYWAGFGIFHSGVEVHGVEYAFGAHDYPSSGVFEVEPRQCPGFKFRKSIFIGTTMLGPYPAYWEDNSKWVNRLAKIGALFNCVLPEALKISAVQHDPSCQACDSEKRRLRSASSCLSSISTRATAVVNIFAVITIPLKAAYHHGN